VGVVIGLEISGVVAGMLTLAALATDWGYVAEQWRNRTWFRRRAA
jgi:hypothetical protein